MYLNNIQYNMKNTSTAILCFASVNSGFFGGFLPMLFSRAVNIDTNHTETIFKGILFISKIAILLT